MRSAPWTMPSGRKMLTAGVYGRPTVRGQRNGWRPATVTIVLSDAVNSSRTRGRAAQNDCWQTTCTKYQNANRTLGQVPGALQAIDCTAVRGAQSVLEHASTYMPLHYQSAGQRYGREHAYLCSSGCSPMLASQTAALCAHQPTHLQVQVNLYAH
jgi:hypothetical protein